ncbi:MAG: type II secretion system protein [Phycisphaeraceae bacterium]
MLRTTHRGFTLVELLVVISIIALLISLLLPSLRAARGAAQRVQCLSNLSQHGVGHHVYKAEHDGYFPQFGGPASYNASRDRWSTQQNRPQQFSNNTQATRLYVEQYMNTAIADNRADKDQPLFYCPTIDWTLREARWPQHWPLSQLNRFHHVSLIGWAGEWAGYSFYTGRKWATQWDTRPRRSRSDEVLMTDLALRWHWGGTGPRPLYFTPHAGQSGTLSPRGNAHMLIADGSASSFDMAEVVSAGRWTISVDGGRYDHLADAEKISAPTSGQNGPYWVAR